MQPSLLEKKTNEIKCRKEERKKKENKEIKDKQKHPITAVVERN